MAGCGKCGRLVGHNGWCETLRQPRPSRNDRRIARHDRKTAAAQKKYTFKGKGGQ